MGLILVRTFNEIDGLFCRETSMNDTIQPRQVVIHNRNITKNQVADQIGGGGDPIVIYGQSAD